MGIWGVASTILGRIGSATAQHANTQQFKQGLKQPGQDLQSGNLSQAQSDFSSLQQLLLSGQQSSLLGPASGTQSTSPLATAVSQLAPERKSGNLSPTSSRICSSPARNRARLMTIITTATPTLAGRPISRIRSSHFSANWDRTSSPAP